MTVYLERASKEVICHCRCRQSLVGAPTQMDCPWCGCGWLFTCLNCRKSYAFARGVEVEQTLEELARDDLQSRTGESPGAEDIAGWVEWMTVLLKAVRVGREYVYLDGYYIDVETGPIEFEGWHSRHDLPWVPQVKAVEDPTVMYDVLTSEDYWRDREVEDRDAASG